MSTATQTEFAGRIGVAKSYVTKLKQLGRLVMADGGLVDVEASLDLLQKTRDESKPSHLNLGNAGHQSAPASPRLAAVPAEEAPVQEQPSPEEMNYQQARSVKERYQALAARRDYEQSCGDLMVAADVLAVVSRIAVTLRTRFESFPDLLAPQLADLRDEHVIRALLADHVQILLADLSAQFAHLAREDRQ